MVWGWTQLTCVALVWAASLSNAKAATEVDAGEHEIGRRRFGNGQLRLVGDADGVARLFFASASGRERPVACDSLVGAWGLWVGDVDGDGVPEAIVALRKTARFDPVLENRLHVYHLTDGQCVPAWRGTRLVGRFDRIAVDGDRLLVLERMNKGWQRIARYRWSGFGYQVERELWRGRGLPGRRWLAKFEEGAHP